MFCQTFLKVVICEWRSSCFPVHFVHKILSLEPFLRRNWLFAHLSPRGSHSGGSSRAPTSKGDVHIFPRNESPCWYFIFNFFSRRMNAHFLGLILVQKYFKMHVSIWEFHFLEKYGYLFSKLEHLLSLWSKWGGTEGYRLQYLHQVSF